VVFAGVSADIRFQAVNFQLILTNRKNNRYAHIFVLIFALATLSNLASAQTQSDIQSKTPVDKDSLAVQKAADDWGYIFNNLEWKNSAAVSLMT
jgi:hypothetical protein